MVPLCYRSATVNGLKNPACILHAPYCDVQDANEMRTVENAKRNERHTGRIRINIALIEDFYVKNNTLTEDFYIFSCSYQKKVVPLRCNFKQINERSRDSDSLL